MEMLYATISTLSQLFIVAYFIYLIVQYYLNSNNAKYTDKKPEKSRSRRSFDKIPDDRNQDEDFDIADNVSKDSLLGRTLLVMKDVEPGFSITEFILGVRGAYEMIVMAFEKGNLDEIRPFLSRNVFDSFVSAVTDREDKGLTIEAEFVGIRNITLINVNFNRNTNQAEITVRIVGELTSVIRDRGGDIIKGSPHTINRQKNNWTFTRMMGSNNPNWLLVGIEDNP